MPTQTLPTTPFISRTPDRSTVKVGALNEASLRRVIEPETEFDFDAVSQGRVLPDELLSIAGLSCSLSEEERARLSREELAAMLKSGIRFEAVLNTVFSFQLAEARELTDPTLLYMLHEVGEETRHQRAFLRLHATLAPTAVDPLENRVTRWAQRRVVRRLMKSPAYFCVLLLAGEEIPDLIQKRAVAHVGVDSVVRSINRYHRQEEARHLAFARLSFPQAWRNAGFVERFYVRHVAAHVVRAIFMGMVHPGVYGTVGLPTWKTWRAANATHERLQLLADATQPILDVLITNDVFADGHVPKVWRRMCGVDRYGKVVPS